ncbi:cyclic nucleotide-binding domain-containing protein [Actinomadura barringtoniae]|uniref:Cyclic nucleotide-binding domain-containing protein n=1 Tax=Actinomadura barringtoniae TaxID=1427535 RepID=A0A939T5L6_9ACTN|nr:cyclic nucleotide-binding domain-containing protein [Actinomadura barringtoniae]MBO2450773.1 cyclic nucleotide-binding domain-containing protein [Actinomadura barringtoniae]
MLSSRQSPPSEPPEEPPTGQATGQGADPNRRRGLARHLGRRRLPALAAWLATFVMGGYFGGASGVALVFLALLVLVVLICAFPVIGLTVNLMRLTESGRDHVTSVDDVRKLMHMNAVAFAKPLATLLDREVEEPARSENGVGTMQKVMPGNGFWARLTKAERDRLRQVARPRRAAPGAVLCREGDAADEVMVLMGGLAKVCVLQAGIERVVAIRGPGELLGERAVTRARTRSASVVTLTDVELLVIGAEDFRAFLAECPRTLDLLQAQFYDRLTEAPPVVEEVEPSALNGLNCSIVFTDITAFGRKDRDDRDRLVLRTVMYEALEAAFDGAGVPWRECYREDRGDGVLIVVPPTHSTRILTRPLADRLARSITEHNRGEEETSQLQLRVAVHVGPIVPDGQGLTGESIIYAARLLDAPAFKQELASAKAGLGYIVSEFVYNTVVRHDDPTGYRKVRVKTKEARMTGWVRLL